MLFRLIRRVLDIAVSLIGLGILSPILAVVAVAVRVDSKGPVLFRQSRVGRNGQEFVLYKFRSMTVGGSGPLVTAGGDSRVTRVGRALRRTKLDEVPQLFNVLKGDMSLVGPRPEVGVHVELYPEEFGELLKERPGITDPASIAYRHEESLLASAVDPAGYYRETVLPAKLDLSIQYARERTLATDLAVIVKTAESIFRPATPVALAKGRHLESTDPRWRWLSGLGDGDASR